MIIVTGQTATGKTKLALELAEEFNGELINFDSRQIYKYLDIITGKDIPKTKIWLYDVVTPDQYFSSFDFVKLALPVIKDIENRKKTPILVGGTYLYLKHLLYGIDKENSPPNFALREKINNYSVPDLQKMLIELNKDTFTKLNHSDQLNPRRLIRKIEILSTPKIKTVFQKTVFKKSVPKQFIGLKYKDKSRLHEAIEKRVTDRLKNGAIDEVKKLLQMGYVESDPGMRTIGYQQIIRLIKKQMTKEEAITEWTNKEIQYAKRQLTFMKKDALIKWREI